MFYSTQHHFAQVETDVFALSQNSIKYLSFRLDTFRSGHFVDRLGDIATPNDENMLRLLEDPHKIKRTLLLV